ncbi:MAG TPA: c-type cytochrome [Pseudolabrys sp.]|nr:c-type cytochrome [Pseudolabrys sp.]
MRYHRLAAFAALALIFLAPQSFAAEGNAARGQRIFGACAPCHSLEPDRNMTGPSLANIWNRKAGALASFDRYSDALKSANIVWNDKTLDEWVANPQHLVPGNHMTFPGVESAQQRADLLAFLKQATKPGGSQAFQKNGAMGGMGGMSGMMGGGKEKDLKKLEPGQRVQSIDYCKDTYTVMMANGATRKFWERNLRLMTDSSGRGPNKNAPVLLPAGMLGDRADAIFSDPSEISRFIKDKCSN